MKLILIGFMGSGKTAVARELAARTGLRVLETDTVVLERTGCSDMNEVFARGGEILLRETEIAICRDIRAMQCGIISTGGGMVMNKICIDYMKEAGGTVIFLDVPFPVLAERVAKDAAARPLFKDIKQARQLYKLRHPLYRAYADFRISAEKLPTELADEIIHILEAKP